MIQKKIECISEALEIDITISDLGRSLDEFEEWDSISVLALMAKADDDFGIALTPDTLQAAQTIQDLINLLEKFDDQ